MTLPVDTESYDYKFNKTLNEDVKLTGNEYGEFDITMDNGDYVNVTGLQSLNNACIIAILTRFGELAPNPTYDEFGCRIHELIKDNQTDMFMYKLESFVYETLESIRRVRTVDSVNLRRVGPHSFNVEFEITSINDEIVRGSVVL